MANEPKENKPKEYDAVLGRQNKPAPGAVVLGGLPGVRQRLASPVPEQRIAALKESVKYAGSGLDLVAGALEDESLLVRRAAYLLLRSRKERKCQQLLQQYNPYPLFECLRTVKAGRVLAISPDGEAIATRRHDNTIKIWNLHSNETLHTIPKHSGHLGQVALSIKGETMIRSTSGRRKGSSNNVEVWDLGKLAYQLYGHELSVSAIALSPDENILATGSEDCTIKLWDLEDDGKLICTFGSRLFFNTHSNTIHCLAFSPDGKHLVSSSWDRTVKLWDLRKRERPQNLDKNSFSLWNALTLSPNGRILAGVEMMQRVCLWDLATRTTLKNFIADSAEITCLAFSPNGKVLMTAGSNGKIKLWNLQSSEPFLTLNGHEDSIDFLRSSPDGQTLISASSDKTIKVWGIG